MGEKKFSENCMWDFGFCFRFVISSETAHITNTRQIHLRLRDLDIQNLSCYKNTFFSPISNYDL